MPKPPIDPLVGAPWVLEGRAVTMDAGRRVEKDARVLLADGVVKAVLARGEPAPPGFPAGAPSVKTGGTIYPGLVELHNHLSYDVLPMWQVPRRFEHRGQWADHEDKRRLISQPMSVLASVGGTIEAVVRYVEAKCLVAGVTASQGMTLVAAPGIEHSYRGIVRNVERTGDPGLPDAATRIADVDDARKFLTRLKKAKGAILLHLAEGKGPAARKHFQALELGGDAWAITRALVGIHGAGLEGADFDLLFRLGGGLVWSPLSNLLLYGDTADVARAKQAKVPLALGSDWSPSGSKNLLAELKVAKAWSDQHGAPFSAEELVAMVTCNPAAMLGWGGALGSLAGGCRADLLVLRGKGGDPYEKLVAAREDDVQLVVIGGVPRFGEAKLMDRAVAVALAEPAPALESRRVAGRATRFNFVQAAADPLVAAVSLAEAERRLTDALGRLPELASGLADPVTASATLGVLGAAAPGMPAQRWTLALDNERTVHGTGDLESVRPLAPWGPGSPEGAIPEIFGASLAANLVSMELDPLTVADDDGYFRRLAPQPNLTDPLKKALARMHGVELPAGPIGRAGGRRGVREGPAARRPPVPRSLAELYALDDGMTREDRVQLLRALRTVLEETYVHLPLKRAAHAVDPLQRLRLLEYALANEKSPPAGLEFHRATLEIFTQLRDLHTLYLLPARYAALTVFLPFLVEACYEGDDERSRRYLVTKVADDLRHPTFRPGVDLLHWNGRPIDRAVRENAERQAGSNAAARLARGLAALTIRPLLHMLPPDEEWVDLVYRTADGVLREIRLPWRIRQGSEVGEFAVPPLSARGLDLDGETKEDRGARPGSGLLAARAAFGVDAQMEAVNATRRDLYAKPAARGRRAGRVRALLGREEVPTRSPVLRAWSVRTPEGTIGHLRIYSFQVDDADAFVAEVVRVLARLPRSGLVIDVRNNGGGLIWAAEQLLQLFTDERIQPEPAQLIATQRMHELARHNSPSPLDASLDLSDWKKSLSQAVVTGAVHSAAFPITPPERANAVGRRYHGPVALVTDALAYSATDIFAAGFLDHGLGWVIGVDENTGAGGANVWSYPLLARLMPPDWPLEPLPGGCDLRVAVRRTLRVGAAAGTPVEDLGIAPHEVHRLQLEDVLGDNEKLLEFAAGLLKRPAPRTADSGFVARAGKARKATGGAR